MLYRSFSGTGPACRYICGEWILKVGDDCGDIFTFKLIGDSDTGDTGLDLLKSPSPWSPWDCDPSPWSPWDCDPSPWSSWDCDPSPWSPWDSDPSPWSSWDSDPDPHEN